jgi:hypothetical protein
MSHAKQLHHRCYLNDYLEIIHRESLPGNVKNELCRQVQDTVIATVQRVIEAALDEELTAYLGRAQSAGLARDTGVDAGRGALVCARETRDSKTASDASESVVRIREKGHTLPHMVILLVVIVCTCVLSYFILRSATRVTHLLGRTGLRILSRLMGMLLAVIAVQFILNGIADALPQLLPARLFE